MIAIPGAAKYYPTINVQTGKWDVWMDDGENSSVIDTKSSLEAARRCADKWQTKENAAVAKSRK